MSGMYVRSGGQIYGPYSQQQLAAMLSSGRITPTTEISADRVTWMQAASIQSRHAAAARPTRGSASGYLTDLRGRTNYPIYRAVVMISTILGFIVAAAPVIVHIVVILNMGFQRYFESVRGEEWRVGLPFFIAALAAVGVKFYQEFATMLVDFVDSTIDHNARQ